MTVYLVFAGANYYPRGDEDLMGVYLHKADAEKRLNDFREEDWSLIVEWEVEESYNADLS